MPLVPSQSGRGDCEHNLEAFACFMPYLLGLITVGLGNQTSTSIGFCRPSFTFVHSEALLCEHSLCLHQLAVSPSPAADVCQVSTALA